MNVSGWNSLSRMVIFAVLVLLAASAWAWDLTGTVRDRDGLPIRSVYVLLRDSETGGQLDLDLTDSEGVYRLETPNGTYDLEVIPPFETGHLTQREHDVVIDGGDLTLDFDVVWAGVTISGSVTDAKGVSLEHVRIGLNGPGWDPCCISTDAEGHWETLAVPGLYTLNYRPNTHSIPSSGSPSFMPDAFRISHPEASSGTNPNIVQDDTVLDMVFPFVDLSGHVVDQWDLPVSDVEVRIEHRTRSSNHSTRITDENGEFAMVLLEGDQEITLTHPPGGEHREYLYLDDVLEDTEDVILRLTASPVSLSGTMRNAAGEPLEGITVAPLHHAEDRVRIGDVITNASGEYHLNLPNGPWSLYIRDNNGDESSPSDMPDFSARYPRDWTGEESFIPSGETTLDFDLPIVTVSGEVRNHLGEFARGFRISFTNQEIRANSSDWIGSDGHYRVALWAGEHSVLITQDLLRIPGAPGMSLTAVPITESGTLDFTLPEGVRISGTLSDQHGVPLDNVPVGAFDLNVAMMGHDLTDDNGHWEIQVLPGDDWRIKMGERMYLSWYHDVEETINAPRPDHLGITYPTHFTSEASLEIVADTVIDITLHIVHLQGSVTDNDGLPIPDVNVMAEGGYPGPVHAEGVKTGDDGGFSLHLLRDDRATIDLNPPTLTRYIPRWSVPLSILEDMERDYTLDIDIAPEAGLLVH